MENDASTERQCPNELIAGVRKAVSEMIIQVGGSISFAPENEGQAAKWLSSDIRHILAELEPTPDQVTVTVTSQMNVTEQAEDADLKGVSRGNPTIVNAYEEMTVLALPGWVCEHMRCSTVDRLWNHSRTERMSTVKQDPTHSSCVFLRQTDLQLPLCNYGFTFAVVVPRSGALST